MSESPVINSLPHLYQVKQVNKVVKCCNYYLSNISRIRKYLSLDAAKKVVVSLVLSRLDYCNSLYAALPGYVIHRLRLVQNTAARIIHGLGKFDHITLVLADLHWLPAPERIDFKMLVLTYKALHGQSPSYIRDLLCANSALRKLRSDIDPTKLKESLVKKPTLGDRAFRFYAPKMWNALPRSIRESNTVDIFKKRLKTYLYRRAFKDYF